VRPRHAEIVECNRGTGEDSFILKVSTVSIEHLKDVIDRLTPFGTTSTSLVLESLIERNLLTPRVSTGEPPANKTGAHPNAPGERQLFKRRF